MKKATISNLRIYVQAENLFTITGYDGLDPEYTNAEMKDVDDNGVGADLKRGIDMAVGLQQDVSCLV